MSTTETIGCPFCSKANEVTFLILSIKKYLTQINMVLNQRNMFAIVVIKKM